MQGGPWPRGAIVPSPNQAPSGGLAGEVRMRALTMANIRAETQAALVAELVDATDLKSVGRKAMPVRFRPGAPALSFLTC